MTTDPLTSINLRRTPQTQSADPRQVPNSAGGYVFQLDDAARLRRFLTLGVDGGTYYAKPQELARENAQVVVDLARTDAELLVSEIVAVSTAGRAPRQQPALFALALTSAIANEAGRRAVYAALPSVARTASALFTFLRYARQFRGWGPGFTRAVARWYTEKSPDDLAYQVTKYRQRDGWTHRDVLRQAHPVANSVDYPRRALHEWIVERDGLDAQERLSLVSGGDAPTLLEGFERVQVETDPRIAARIVTEYGLSWEMLPDAVINSPLVWEALLERGVPQTALMRQLPRLTRLGLLAPLAAGSWDTRVAAQLTDPERLIRARVHPLNVLVALRTYAAGHSERGSSTWIPSRSIVDALDAAFYAAFGAVTPTNKRTLLALDVSASMTWHNVVGMPLTPRDASAALALVTARVEPQHEVVAFTGGWGPPGLTSLAISNQQRLDDVIHAMNQLHAGGTDCSLPMRHAIDRGLEVDTFVIYTDNETWAGEEHAHQALRRYRERSGIAARLVVVGMTSTGFSIADPADPGSLDVVGFDTATPQLISDFARGDV